MGAGDRVVVMSSERRGSVAYVSADDVVYVVRDDLVGTPLETLNPMPYDRHELEVCNV